MTPREAALAEIDRILGKVREMWIAALDNGESPCSELHAGEGFTYMAKPKPRGFTGRDGTGHRWVDGRLVE